MQRCLVGGVEWKDEGDLWCMGQRTLWMGGVGGIRAIWGVGCAQGVAGRQASVAAGLKKNGS